MPFIDFAVVKEMVSIERTVQLLRLNVTKSGNQLRAACPICESGGDRALAITPAKNLFYCFPAQSGGDQIQLAAHVRDESVKEAAEWLQEMVQVPVKVPSTSTGTVSKDRAEGFPALDYLQPDHEAVVTVGFDPETAKALGIGYAPKGILRGTVAIPLRLQDGLIAGYIGVTEARLPTKWHGIPPSNVIPLKKGAA